MKKGILLAAAILLSAAGFAQAQEGELSGTADLTFLSSYIWRGFDIYSENHPALQPSIDLDLYGTGLGTKLFFSRPLGDGNENNEGLNFTLYYGNNLFEGQTYATNYKLGWVYYNYPDEPVKAAHMQEFFASLSWPDMCATGIVPSYTIVCMWPAKGGSQVGTNGGWIHILGLGYDWTVPGFVPETPEQILHCSLELVYNDGAAPGSVWPANVDHDWSHAVLGISTGFEVAEKVTFTPGLYYQVSMDDSVNDEDEFWISLGLSYKF